MTLATVFLPRYHKFLEALTAKWIFQLADVWHNEGAPYACLLILSILGTLYAVLQPTLFRVAFAALVVVVPFHANEVLQRPEVVKWAMYILATLALLPRTELATKMLFLYALMWRAWLRLQYIQWVEGQVRAQLAAPA